MMRLAPACAVPGLILAAITGDAQADTTCRARDTFAIQDQILCIPTPEGPRLARCGMVLNVTSWTFLDEPCPPRLSADAPDDVEQKPRPSPADRGD